MLRLTISLALLVGTAFCCPGSIHAQGSSSVEEAKQEFFEGAAAAERGRWEEAGRRFMRAYELSNRASALLNYAISMKELGRFVEAKEACDRLRQDHRDEEDLEETMRQLCLDAAGGITVLNLRGMRPGVTHEITLNGRPVPDPGNRPLRLESNPGTIQLEVGIPGNTNVFTWSGQASAGESLRVRIQIDEATSDGPGVLESPWFWVAVGGVALAGAGVGLYFALDSAADLEPNNKGFHITLTD